MLNPNYMYSISDNCSVRIGEHGNVVSQFGKDIIEASDMEVDLRMSLISYNSTKDLVEYFRYFNVVSMSAARKLASEEFMKGNFVAMLDNGYVPFYMPPSYMPRHLGDEFKELIGGTGIRYFEEKAMRFDGLKVDSLANDIWISRMDAAEYMHCSLRKFSVLKFIKEVWDRADN